LPHGFLKTDNPYSSLGALHQFVNNIGLEPMRFFGKDLKIMPVKSIESIFGPHPDEAFPIFQKGQYLVI
jgi:hypothetical protein